LCKSMTW